MKQIFLSLFLTIIFSSCGNTVSPISPTKKPSSKLSLIKKTIVRELSFLPFIKYEFSLEPSPAGGEILIKLHEFEKIVDDHVNFNNRDKEKKPIALGNMNLSRFFWKKEDNETLDEKIAEIKLIKSLTGRYENWGPQYDKTADLVGNQLSIYDINSLQKEIKRISKKL